MLLVLRKIERPYSPVMELCPGPYETLITTELAALIAALPDELVERRALSMAETADHIGLHLNGEINRALADVPDDDRVGISVRVAQRLFDDLSHLARVDTASRITATGQVFRAVLQHELARQGSLAAN